ncbi:MAG: cell division protein FtsL [Gammaproteobacteria bacterium]|nr:cell division protein FtsL [Gammaproteobacteria bacterium]
MNALLDTFRWLGQGQRLIKIVLGVLVVISALGVVGASHETRSMYSELQALHKEQDDLESEYGKLLLEQSAWSNNTRVDEIARNELNMVPPEVSKIIVVRK